MEKQAKNEEEAMGEDAQKESQADDDKDN